MSSIFILNSNIVIDEKDNIFFVLKDNKKIIINETVYLLLKEFEVKSDINELLKFNSKNCNKREKILKEFYENILKLEFIVPAEINEKLNKNLNIGDKINGYKVTNLLYEGNNTIIYLCVKNDIQFILKTTIFRNKKTNELARLRMANEYKILMNICNPYIVGVFDFFSIGVNHCLILEYVKGKNLKSYLKSEEVQDYDTKLMLTKNIVNAFSFLHQQKLLHGDIHDKNIIVCENSLKVKLIDFEFTNSIEEIKNTSKVGVDLFAPPERIGDSIFNKFNEVSSLRSEVYQIGLVIYLIFFKKLPFKSVTWKSLKIEKENYVFNSKTNVEIIDTILEKCLSKEPSKRFESILEIQILINNYYEKS